MRPCLVSPSLLLLTSFASTATALEALTNSPCAVQCGNDLGGTSSADIVCPDSSYTGTLAGTTFSSCITCQLGSTYVDPVTNQTDLQWALYNLRYAVSFCLFGYPNNTDIGDTPCITNEACGPLQDSFEFDSLAPNAAEYGYCSIMLNSIYVPKCSDCLVEQSTEYYLNNFLTALNAGCIQQPKPGNTISIQGTLFSTTAVNITTPSAVAGPYVPQHGLTLGAKIGIAVGALLLILVVSGFCIIWNGRRRRRAVLQRVQRESGYDDWRKQHHFTPETDLRGAPFAGAAPPRNTPPMSAGPFFDSPDSQQPLHHPWSARPPGGEEDSPASAYGYGYGNGEKVYFSPYTSNYSSPVSAHDQNPPVSLGSQSQWPAERKANSNVHSPIDVSRDWSVDRKGSGSVAGGSGKLRSRSKEKREAEWDGGQFEMQNVAPALMHPGHGRRGSAGLMEDDARRGDAL